MCYFISIYNWRIEPKEDNIVLFITLSKNIIDKLFQAHLPEKKKEGRKLQNVNLIKSRKNRHISHKEK